MVFVTRVFAATAHQCSEERSYRWGQSFHFLARLGDLWLAIVGLFAILNEPSFHRENQGASFRVQVGKWLSVETGIGARDCRAPARSSLPVSILARLRSLALQGPCTVNGLRWAAASASQTER